jgi:hypothetical protein
VKKASVLRCHHFKWLKIARITLVLVEISLTADEALEQQRALIKPDGGFIFDSGFPRE